MSKIKRHIFVCENIRDKSNSKQSCGRLGGIENREELKRRLRELGLSKNIRANKSGCLGACHHGPVAVVYPEGRWYGEIELDDIEEIIQKDLINNEVVKRLEIEDDY
ncbi:MAG: (2Fe-2S) ferredoxin domain-containing protein [Melioribacteraceae bacterium]|nr:(2Fe-2S) ferredoxin domain-containing protein [Melioribacteraceae bacterium]